MTPSYDSRDQDNAAFDMEGRGMTPREGSAPRNLARWYWGTAGLLVAVAVGLSAIADRPTGDGRSGDPDAAAVEEQSKDSAT